MTIRTRTFAGTIAVWTVAMCVGFGFYVDHAVERGIDAQLEEVNSKLAAVVQQQQKAAKVAVVDLGKIANEWRHEGEESALAAVDTTVKFYNDKGYLVIDRTSIIGEMGDYDARVPTPEKMRKLMGQTKQQ